MRQFVILVALVGALGVGGVMYLLHVADTMAPAQAQQEVELDVTLPR